MVADTCSVFVACSYCRDISWQVERFFHLLLFLFSFVETQPYLHPWLAWLLLWRSGCSWIHRTLPASASRVLRLKVCVPPCLASDKFFNWERKKKTSSFLHLSWRSAPQESRRLSTWGQFFTVSGSSAFCRVPAILGIGPSKLHQAPCWGWLLWLHLKPCN